MMPARGMGQEISRPTPHHGPWAGARVGPHRSSILRPGGAIMPRGGSGRIDPGTLQMRRPSPITGRWRGTTQAILTGDLAEEQKGQPNRVGGPFPSIKVGHPGLSNARTGQAALTYEPGGFSVRSIYEATYPLREDLFVRQLGPSDTPNQGGAGRSRAAGDGYPGNFKTAILGNFKALILGNFKPVLTLARHGQPVR